MKTKLLLLIATLITALFGPGCASSPEGEAKFTFIAVNTPLNEKEKQLVGAYRSIRTHRLASPKGELPTEKDTESEALILFKNREAEIKGKKGKWRILNGELHILDTSFGPLINVYKIGVDGSLLKIALIEQGERGVFPRILARTWKKASTTQKGEELPKTILDSNNSPAATAAITKAIQVWTRKPAGEITDEDLKKVFQLRLASEGITDVSLLGKCSNLVAIVLADNNITDISPLSRLSHLQILALGGNKITNINNLNGLSKLTKLDVPLNQITDISSLARLKKLEELYLAGNRITNINALKNLSNLRILALHANKIDDISSLSGLKNLRSLDLRGNPSLTRGQIDELQKALPKCKIEHNAKK